MSLLDEIAAVIPGEVITRDQWGAPAEPGGSARETGDVRRWVQHWTTGRALGRDDVTGWVANIYRFHTEDRGWQDIGYNLLVDRDGNVYEGRGVERIGAHAPGANEDGLGVAALAGHAEDVSPRMLAALARTYKVCAETLPSLGRAIGHRDVSGTRCPGETLHAWVHRGMPDPMEEDGMDEEQVRAIAREEADRRIADHFDLDDAEQARHLTETHRALVQGTDEAGSSLLGLARWAPLAVRALREDGVLPGDFEEAADRFPGGEDDDG